MTDETPRTDAGSGMIRWTLTGPRAAPPEPRRSWMERGTDAMNEADERAMRMGPNACPDCGGGHAAWCEAAPQGQPLDVERPRAINDHERRCPDCQRVIAEEQREYDGRLAESSERPGADYGINGGDMLIDREGRVESSEHPE